MRMCVPDWRRIASQTKMCILVSPPGWVENGQAAVLRLAHSPQRGCLAPRALPAARFEPNKSPTKVHDTL